MIQAIRRNAVILAGMALAAFLCLLATRTLASERGALVPSVFFAESPIRATIWVSGCLILAAMIGAVVGRTTNAAVGTFVLGCGVFMLAGRTDTAEEVARTGSLWLVPIELLWWSALSMVAVYLLFRMSGWLADVEPDADGHEPHWFRSPQAFKGAAAGIVVVPAVLLLASTAMKGQVIAAVGVGSVVAGLVGRMISPHVQPVLLFVSPLVFGAAGYWFGLSQLGTVGTTADTATLGALSRLCLPMPLDYLAGTFIGIPMGYGWAKSFLAHEEGEQEGQGVRIRRAS